MLLNICQDWSVKEERRPEKLGKKVAVQIFYRGSKLQHSVAIHVRIQSKQVGRLGMSKIPLSVCPQKHAWNFKFDIMIRILEIEGWAPIGSYPEINADHLRELSSHFSNLQRTLPTIS